MGTSTSTTKQSSTGTQTQNLDPQQQKITKFLFQQIRDALKLGPQVSESDRNTSRAQINQQFTGAENNLESTLQARGFGNSGNLGRGFEQLAIGRNTAMQSDEARLRDEAQTRFQSMIQNAFRFNIPRSTTSTSSGTSKTESDPSIFSDILGAVGTLIG